MASLKYAPPLTDSFNESPLRRNSVLISAKYFVRTENEIDLKKRLLDRGLHCIRSSSYPQNREGFRGHRSIALSKEFLSSLALLLAVSLCVFSSQVVGVVVHISVHGAFYSPSSRGVAGGSGS